MQPVRILVGAVVSQQTRVCRSYYFPTVFHMGVSQYDLPSEGIEAAENVG